MNITPHFLETTVLALSFANDPIQTILYGIGILVLLVIAILILNFGMIWVRALFSGARVTFTELIALRLRSVPVGLVVDTRITAIKSGLRLDFDRACAIDLATKGTKKTVLEAVKTSVNPKVIDCPEPAAGKTTIDAVARDGIVIKAKARVTVRTNLDRFVGGATEETIVARVGEGIVTTIGSATSYKDVLENPDRISKNVLGRALDSNTAFEILSIDIADVDVGGNVGAKLQAEQAEANKLIAQAQAEVRRAAAVALEQEMTARVAEMRARVVEAEAQVPLAMAVAFRSGNLGVMV
jgi:uncharacterized protein YqfA (UPF0365 family)